MNSLYLEGKHLQIIRYLPLPDKRKSGKFFSIFISVVAFVYTFVGFGLSGLPGVSRLSFISAVVLAFCLLMCKKQILIPAWLSSIVLLYLYLIVPAFGLVPIPWETIGSIVTLFFGTIAISTALASNLVSSRTIVYGMLTAGIINVIALINGIDTSPSNTVYAVGVDNRLSGLLGNSNLLAINMSLAALAIWFSPERFPRMVRFGSLLLAAYGIYMSGSRKGVIYGTSLLLLASRSLISRWTIPVQLFWTGALVILAIFFEQAILDCAHFLQSNVVAIDRFTQIFYNEASFNERTWMIETGYKIWRDAPFFGSGLSQFAEISGFMTYSHNNYIELLVSGGGIALFLYYFPYGNCLISAYRYNRQIFPSVLLLVVTMLISDTAAVSFSSRQILLFLAWLSFQSIPSRRPV